MVTGPVAPPAVVKRDTASATGSGSDCQAPADLWVWASCTGSAAAVAAAIITSVPTSRWPRTCIRQAQDLDALRDQGVGAVTQVVPKKVPSRAGTGAQASAPWLAYPATAVYRDADPKVVLAGLLGEHPVVYQLSRPESTPRVSHTGGEATLKDYLDGIMLQTNWSYRLHGGVMIVSDILAREFRLLVPPGARSYNLGKSSLESDSGGGSNDLSGGEDPYEALASAMTSLGFDRWRWR